MPFNQFSAGKKVYSRGSFAPTRGTVNPKGYIQRELKNRAMKKRLMANSSPAMGKPWMGKRRAVGTKPTARDASNALAYMKRKR